MEAQKATNLASSIPREETEEYQPMEHLPSSGHDNANGEDHTNDFLQELNSLLPTILQLDDMDDMDEDLILDRTIGYIKFLKMSEQMCVQMEEKTKVMNAALNTLNNEILKTELTIALYKLMNAEREIKCVHRRKRD